MAQNSPKKLLFFKLIKFLDHVSTHFLGCRRQCQPSVTIEGLGLVTHLFVKVPQPGDSEGTFSVIAHLFVKVPQPGDSEGTFSVIESSCHLFYHW